MRFECVWFPGAVFGVAFESRGYEERVLYIIVLCLAFSFGWKKWRKA